MKKRLFGYVSVAVVLLGACVPLHPAPLKVRYAVSQNESLAAQMLPVQFLEAKPPKTGKPPKTEKPPKTKEPPPSQTKEPPVKTEKPPVQTEKPPVQTEPPSHTTQPPADPPVTTPRPPSVSNRIVPNRADIPLAASDPFNTEMRISGYVLNQSASLTDQRGNLYSVYVFFRPDIKEKVSRTSWVLAFYRSDGNNNMLLGTAYPSPYTAHSPLYPRNYRLVNWDEAIPNLAPSLGIASLDPGARSLFQLGGFGSDINHNQQPEFALAAEYCPELCAQPSYSVDFFEITARQRIANLSQDLPGRLTLERVADNPVTLRVYDVYPYDPFSQIRLGYEVAWDGKGFSDVTSQQADQHLAELGKLANELKSKTGQPLASSDIEISLWQGLLGYQRLLDQQSGNEQTDLRNEGLQAFLAISDPANWPGSDQPTFCWLALARAHVQQEADHQQEFTLFPSRNDLFGNQPSQNLKSLIQGLSGAGYDVSACQVFLQPKD